MNLPAFALKNKTIVMVVAILLMLLGVNVYLTAPRKEDPSFTIREAWIITIWPGATARQVERLVADPIEDAMSGVEAVRKIDTTSYVNYCVTQISLQDQYSDAGAVWDKVRRELTLIEPNLPPGCMSPILNDHASQAAVFMLCLYQNPDAAEKKKYTPREMEDYATALRDRIIDLRPVMEGPDGELIPDPSQSAFVERVTLYGVQQEAIYIETDLGKWSQLQMSPLQLQMLLEARNAVVPGGSIDTENEKFNIHTASQFDAVHEIQNMTAARVAVTSGGRKLAQPLAMLTQKAVSAAESLGPLPAPLTQNIPVKLKDLELDVIRDYEDPPQEFARFSDAERSSDCIVMAFTMKGDVNIVALDEQMNALLSTANESVLPPDIVVTKVSDQPKAVDKKVKEVISNVVSSVVVVLVVLLVMAGVRTAAISAIAIVMIMLTAMGLMQFWGIAIEQMSLAALIIALGILVDNTIQVCSNTQSFLDEGRPRDEAAVAGPNQIMLSTLIASGTILAAFLPMTVALKGSMQEYIYSVPMVVSLCIAVGWVYAYTMTVIMAWIGLRPSKPKPASDKKKSRAGYIAMCLGAIKAKWITAAVSYAFLFAAFALPVSSDFFPLSDRNQFVIDVYLPESAPISRTREVSAQLEQLVLGLSKKTWQDGHWVAVDGDDSRFVNICTMIGTGGPYNYPGLFPKDSGSNYGIAWVNTQSGDQVARFVEDVKVAAMNGIGEPGSADYVPPIVGARIVPHQLVMGTPVKSPVDIRLLGPRLGNEQVFRKYGERIQAAVRNTRIAFDVHNSWGEYGRQIDVRLDEDKANLAGVTNLDVALSLNAYYSGHPLTKFREDDRQIPIKLRLPPLQRRSLSEIDTVYVNSLMGKVPLESVAEISRSWQPAKLQRYQRNRCFSVRARPAAGVLYSEVIDSVQPELDSIQAELPSGYRIEHGGTKEEADKGLTMNMGSLAISGVLIFVLLVIQYNSIIRPLMIFLTIPLAIAGGYLGLYIHGFSLGFMETLGFMALMGIVLSAAILLIDFSELLVKQKLAAGEGIAAPGEPSSAGLKREVFRQCLAEAGQLRFKPIMMTTLTTVGGLLTLMLGGGPLFKGLAAVIVYGLVIGTGFTLFFIPAIFAIFVENFGMKIQADEQTSQ